MKLSEIRKEINTARNARMAKTKVNQMFIVITIIGSIVLLIMLGIIGTIGWYIATKNNVAKIANLWIANPPNAPQAQQEQIQMNQVNQNLANPRGLIEPV